MPLNTLIERDGETLHLNWAAFHYAAMVYAVAFEKGKSAPNDDVDYPTAPQGLSPENTFLIGYHTINDLVPSGHYTLKHDHHFQDTMTGEFLKLKSGDKLSFWRTHK